MLHFDSVIDAPKTSFAEQIKLGLSEIEFSKSDRSHYFTWAEQIGRHRIDHIVSNKHRGAYDRAAQVLGALIETYIVMDEAEKARQLFHELYKEKFNRFPALTAIAG